MKGGKRSTDQVSQSFLCMVSDASQPPMTLDLSLNESAGSRPLHRLERPSVCYYVSSFPDTFATSAGDPESENSPASSAKPKSAPWQAVEAMGKHLDKPVTIDAATTANALQELKARALDGCDVFSLHAALAAGVNFVVTDVGVFCVVPGTVRFTANRTVIGAAMVRGKLVTRRVVW